MASTTVHGGRHGGSDWKTSVLSASIRHHSRLSLSCKGLVLHVHALKAMSEGREIRSGGVMHAVALTGLHT